MTTPAAPPSGPYDFILVGAFNYPGGDASANRLLALAQATQAADRHPLVVNDSPPFDDRDRAGEIRTFRGVDYVNIGAAGGSRGRRLLLRLSRPIRLLRIIRSAGYQPAQSFASVSSSLYTPGVHLVLKLLLRIRTISDVVERHDVEQFLAGRRSPYFLRHRWTSFLSRFLPDGVIAVSRTLEAVYLPTRRVLRVPPLIDLDEYPPPHPRSPSDPLTLLYAGTPTRKDQLGALVDAVVAANGATRRVTLLVAGADAGQLAASEEVGPERVSRFGEAIKPLGILARADILRQLQTADFSVLFRPLDGYAQAGFPSKVPESLAAGCPILGNLTSDLGDYLRDGENAVLCDSEPATRMVSAVSLQDAFERIDRMTDAELFDLRLAARSSAEEFHYARWGPVLQSWLRTFDA